MALSQNGYQIFDFAKYPLSSEEAVTIPGIYEKLESLVKAPLFINFSIGDAEIKPFYPVINVDGNDFAFALNSVSSTTQVSAIVSIANNDEVTLTVV